MRDCINRQLKTRRIKMGKIRSGVSNEVEVYLESISKGCPMRLDHNLHRQHPLLKTLRPDYLCDSCGLASSDDKGWSYFCAICDFDLHPKCALEPSPTGDVGTTSLLTHNLHQDHPLVKTPQKEGFFWCQGCSEKGHSQSYSCKACEFHMHVGCAEETRGENEPPAEISMVLEMARTPRESYWCNLCAEEGKAWSYSCDGSGLDLHPICAAKMQKHQPQQRRRGRSGIGSWPTRVLLHPLHREHELVRVLKVAYLCDKCRSQGRGWTFRCDACDFDLHPKCATDEDLEVGLGDLTPTNETSPPPQQQVNLSGNLGGGAQPVPALEEQVKKLEFYEEKADLIRSNGQMKSFERFQYAPRFL